MSGKKIITRVILSLEPLSLPIEFKDPAGHSADSPVSLVPPFPSETATVP